MSEEEKVPQDKSAQGNISSFVHKTFEEYSNARQDKEKILEECRWNLKAQYSSGMQSQWRKSEAKMKPGEKIFHRMTSAKVRGATAKVTDAMAQWNFDLKPLVEDEKTKPKIEAMKEELERYYMLDEFPTTSVPRWIYEAAWSGTGVLRTSMYGKYVEASYEMNEVGEDYEVKEAAQKYPASEVVSIFQVYPAPGAETPQDGDGFMILHRIPPGKLRKEGEKLGWNMDAVSNLLKEGVQDSSGEESWESPVREADQSDSTSETLRNKHRVKEFWGLCKVEDLKEYDIDNIPEGMEDYDYVEAVLVVSGAEVLKAKVNPWYPVPYRPFLSFQWDRGPDTFFGEGVSEQLLNFQRLSNGALRLFVLNKAFSSNAMWQVDLSRLKPGQDTNTFYPGKRWVLKDGAAGPAISPVLLPDVSNQLLDMFTLMEKLADDATGITAQSVGSDAPQNAKTATGQAILAGNASLLMKERMRRFDEQLEQKVEWDKRWLMEFGEDPSIKTPAKVKATGVLKTAMIKELQNAQLMGLMQLLPGLMQLPAEGKQGTAVQNLDLSGMVEHLLTMFDMEGLVKDDDESNLDEGTLEKLMGAIKQYGGELTKERGKLAALRGGGAQTGGNGRGALPAPGGGSPDNVDEVIAGAQPDQTGDVRRPRG